MVRFLEPVDCGVGRVLFDRIYLACPPRQLVYWPCLWRPIAILKRDLGSGSAHHENLAASHRVLLFLLNSSGRLGASVPKPAHDMEATRFRVVHKRSALTARVTLADGSNRCRYTVCASSTTTSPELHSWRSAESWDFTSSRPEIAP